MITKALIESVKLGEGKRLKPYKCTAGKLTIGYGRNLDDVGITDEEAELLLQHDLERSEKEAETLPFYNELNQCRKEVLIEMVFNMGLAKVKQFQKMFIAIGKKDFSKAADEMLDSRWAVQTKDRAKRLAYFMRIG